MIRSTFIALCAAVICLAPNLTLADSHRIETTPTAWWWYHGQSAFEIVDIINDNGARLTDIEIQSTDPLRFTCAFVHNSGVYAETWWWYYDQTADDVAIALGRNDARLIDIERYKTPGGPRYAVIMVDNTGPDAKTWWWYVGAREESLTVLVEENNARLVDIEAYQDGGTRYAAIMIENTGDDAMEWWWYFNVPSTTIWNNIAAHGSRVLEYQLRDPATGTVDAILIQNEAPDNINWWWYYGVTQSQLNALLAQNGARIADIDTYLDTDTRRYTVVMINNSNELTTKMGELLGYGTDGATGVYLQEVEGPVLASLQPTYVFEPSSSIKVVHNLYAMREVMFLQDDLADEFYVAEGIDGISCPNGGPPLNWQSLEETLQGMMQNSDNTDTEAIDQRYGRNNINNMAAIVVGMNNTTINRTLGCPWTPLNEMTLVDAALLYEGVATGVLLDSDTREDFYRLMQSETTTNPWWFTNDLENLIDEVATDLGIPEIAGDYWDNTRLAWKPGGDTMFGYEYRSVSGWVSLPLCDGGSFTESKEYVFGLFIHEAVDENYCNDRYSDHTIELFRDEVTAGLQSCMTAVGDRPEQPIDRMLRSTYPNPFNPRTVIEFDVPWSQRVSVAVYDMTGRRIASLADREFAAGDHQLIWNGMDSAGRARSSGTYLVRLQTQDVVESRKIMLVR